MEYSSLKQWNTSLSKQYTASTILQCCYVVFGVLGNLLVILLYRFKMRGQKEDRFFIPVLAVVDLTGCLTSASLSIAQNLFPVMFPSGVLCKLLFFSTSVTIISSLLLLFVISIQRYQKICIPFGWQMSEVHKYCCVAATVFFAAVLSAPVVVLYGNHPMHKDNITGVTCSVGKGKHTDLAIYNYIILTLECIVVGIMTYLYFLVGKRVFYSFKSMKSYKRNFSISKNSNAAVHCPSEDESFISKDSADVFDKEEEPEKISADGESKYVQSKVEVNKTEVKTEGKSQEPVSILVCNASTQTTTRRGPKKSLSIDTSHEVSVCPCDDVSEIDLEVNGSLPPPGDEEPVFSLGSEDAPGHPCTEELQTVYEDGALEKKVSEKVARNGGTEKFDYPEMTKRLRKQSSNLSLGSRRNQSSSALNRQRNQSNSSFSKYRNQSAPSLSKTRQQSVSSFNKDRKASNVDSIYSNKSSCAAHRYTIMFIVISFVAIVTYIPPWIFIIMETQDHEFWSALTYGESVTFLIIRRIYIINHVVNPVIYGLFDGRFRYTLKRMLCPKMNPVV